MLGSEGEGEKSEREIEKERVFVCVSEVLEACNKGQTLKASCGGRKGREGRGGGREGGELEEQKPSRSRQENEKKGRR